MRGDGSTRSAVAFGRLAPHARLRRLLRIPTIDIAEVGAGGGSIAWLDTAGGLQVGPRSAGADPGPACYGRGGTQPTVTDANVFLGFVPEGPLADGEIDVDRSLAAGALEPLAAELDVTAVELATGIHAIANARMMRALRSVSSEKGRDPRDFALIAYGAPARCTRPGSPRTSAAAPCSSPRWRGSSAPSACSTPGPSSTRCAPSISTRAPSSHASWTRSSTS